MMGALDNLVKGAAGQAVQNMNLLFGLPEDEGLEAAADVPVNDRKWDRRRLRYKGDAYEDHRGRRCQREGFFRSRGSSGNQI